MGGVMIVHVGADGKARKVSEFSTDKTEAGTQAVVPGAERIGTRELLQRRADGPAVHAPAAKQKPADDGLFDVAGRKQKELF